MEKQKKVEELQINEQSLQNLLLQKQIFQIELVETNNAIENLKDVKGDVFKIVGNLMFKADQASLKKELERKKQLLDIRIKAIENQEYEIKEKIAKKRDEILKDMK